MPRILVGLTLLFSMFGVGACANEEPMAREHAAGGFIAVVAANAEESSAWYRETFGLKLLRELSGETYKIHLLKGDAGIVEIIEPMPPAPENPGRAIGLFKAGFILDDFDARVAQWREDGVEFFGNGQVFFDEALQLHSVIILDPDGNRIQVFGVSEISN